MQLISLSRIDARLVAAAKITFGVALLAVLLVRIPLAESLAVLTRGDAVMYACGLLCFGASRFFDAVRLTTLVPNWAMPLGASIRATAVSTFFNNCTTTAVGDLYRAAQVKNHVEVWPKALAVVLADRIVGLGALLVLAVTYLSIFDASWFATASIWREAAPANTLWLSIGALGVVGACVLLGWRGRVLLVSFLDQARRLPRQIPLSRWVLALATAVTSQVLLAAMVFVLLAAIGTTATFVDLLFVMLAVYLASMIPLSIGALGIREGVMVILLVAGGIDEIAAVAAALTSRAIMYVYALLGGLWFVMTRGSRVVVAQG